jgi:hypothetical protein
MSTPGAAANIHDLLARLQRPQAEGISGAREGFDGGLWYAGQPFILVAEQARQPATGMEVEAAPGFQRRQLVLLLDRGTQRF